MERAVGEQEDKVNQSQAGSGVKGATLRSRWDSSVLVFHKAVDRTWGSFTLHQLKWVTVIVPIVFLSLYYYLMLGPADRLFHSFKGYVLMVALLAVGGTFFSACVFYVVEQMQKTIIRHRDQMRALNEAGNALSGEMHLAALLQKTTNLGRSLVGAEYAKLEVLGRAGTVKEVFTDGSPLCSETVPKLRVSIAYNGQVRANLSVSRREGDRDFSVPDKEVMTIFATQASIAMVNARLYEEAQALAVETERSRIAQEMHDELAQLLAYLNAKVLAVGEFLHAGQVGEAEAQLSQLAQATQTIYDDVRESILALRQHVSGGRELPGALQRYIADFQEQSGILTQLSFYPRADAFHLSPSQQVQVLRIVQEALTNTRKHTQASEVEVSLTLRERDVEVSIADNGHGFDPSQISSDGGLHFGFRTMRERAEAIDGELSVSSAPGRGTRVTLVLPVGSGG